MLSKFFIVFLLFSLSPLAFANNSKGNWLCSDADFEIVGQDYRADSEDINSRIGYAHCLIVKGHDRQGMAILHNIVDNSDEPERVKAAWMVANYISTGGTLEDTTDENNIDEAIEAYLKVISFISSDPYYPERGNSLYEEEAQMELKTHYRLPKLYFSKFKYGTAGSDHMYLLSSPSYDGDRDLKTYPEYNPYTVNSLERMVEFADVCLDLSFKRHFKRRVYEATKAECRVLKETALAILPLERERLVLLNTDSCSNDVFQCDEYNRILLEEINPIIRQANSDIDEIVQEYASL